MKYSEYRITELKQAVLSAYAKLPIEIKTKSMEEAFKVEEPKYERNLVQQLEATKRAVTYSKFIRPLNELVDKGIIDFNKDAPLEEIVKLLQ